MCAKNSNPTRPKKPTQHEKRRAKVGNLTVFKLVSEIFYQPDKSLDQLSRSLNLSGSTIKRMLRSLRGASVTTGRLGSLHLYLDRLAKEPFFFSKAVVAVDSDIQRLKELGRTDASSQYKSEEELLEWICNTLPRTAPYKGAVIVEMGSILMGSPELGLAVTVYGATNSVLFEFARQGIEMADGVNRTRTMMVAHTIRSKNMH